MQIYDDIESLLINVQQIKKDAFSGREHVLNVI